MRLRTKIFLSLSIFIIILSIGAYLLIKNANLILKNKLEQAVEGLKVERVDLHWRSIRAFNPVFRKPDGTTAFRADQIYLSLELFKAIKKEYALSSLVLKNPYLLIETDRQGRYMNPFAKKGVKASGPAPQISIRHFIVHSGSMDYRDGKVSLLPHLTRLRNIELEIDNVNIPLSNTVSPFTLEARVPGRNTTGIIKGAGKINLKTTDLDCKVTIKDLDITGFKPYFQKKGEANITKGILDVDMKASIKGGIINAPGRATLKGLEFQSTGSMKDRFLGVPRAAVLNLLKNSNDEITIDFIIKGDLKNPKFSLRDSFIEKMTIGLAEKLGLSVTRIGESIIVEGAKQIEKGLKGFGEEIGKIFK